MKTNVIWLSTIGVLAVPATALAQVIPEHPHFFGGDMMGFGAMMIFGPLFFLVFVAIAVAIVVLLFRWLGDGHGFAGHPRHPGQSAADILKERFARGEIDKQEFEDRRRTLSE